MKILEIENIVEVNVSKENDKIIIATIEESCNNWFYIKIEITEQEMQELKEACNIFNNIFNKEE